MAVPISAPRNELVIANSREFRIERWKVAFVKTFAIHSRLCFWIPPTLPISNATVGINSNITQKIRNGENARMSPIRLHVRPDMSAAGLGWSRARPAVRAGGPRHPVGGGDMAPAGGGGQGRQAPTSIVQSVASRAIASAAAFQSLMGFTASYCDASGNLAARSAGISTPLTSARAYF